MSAGLDQLAGPGGAVELLERSLAYTRVALAEVTDPLLVRPTPCAGWSLGDLLAHMEDALDAFTEAALGRVLGPDVETCSAGRADERPATLRVASLQRRACALLGAWTTPPGPGGGIAVGDRALTHPLLVTTAALEITVHGWDVGQATGHGRRVPESLARALLDPASRLVGPGDRGVRFGPPLPVGADAGPDARLLAFLGRDPAGPAASGPGDRGMLPGLAS